MLTFTALPAVAAVLAFLAVAMVSSVVIARGRTAGVRRSLAHVLSIGAINPADLSLRDENPVSLVRSNWESLSSRVILPANETHLRRSLSRAGRITTRDFQQVVARKLLFAVLGAAVGMMFVMRAGSWGWLMLVALCVGGYFLPDLLVYNAGLRRTERILLSLPDALDLLHLCVESGLSLQASLARVSESQSGPVAAEFGRVLKEMQLGVSRADAFAALGERTTQPDLQRFVAAVQQVDRLGIPVATVLREQASEMRLKRHARAREQAQKVPVKILAPLMLCFLPGLFIIILGPAVINAVNFFVR